MPVNKKTLRRDYDIGDNFGNEFMDVNIINKKIDEQGAYSQIYNRHKKIKVSLHHHLFSTFIPKCPKFLQTKTDHESDHKRRN